MNPSRSHGMPRRRGPTRRGWGDDPIDGKSPVVVLSMRYDRIDYFWHTLLHELWHLQKRHGHRDDNFPIVANTFGENSHKVATRSEAERLDDSLAAETLIP